MTLELSVIVPTYNERDNLPILIEKLNCSLRDVSWEIIIVDDDSPDGTSILAKELASLDSRVRCIRRVGRRGLAGACIEGMLSSSSPYVAVMDADLQHDEGILPIMLKKLRAEKLDLVIGSRYNEDGSSINGFSKSRSVLSQAASSSARKIFKINIRDIMSGYFIMRREKFDHIAPRLSRSGFKILFDILVTSDSSLRIEEIGYNFRKRKLGSSKIDAIVIFDYLGLLINKLTYGIIPIRFTVFAIVGSSGIIVHMILLYLLHSQLLFRFSAAQSFAAIVAMTSNYFVNNYVTYNDIKIRNKKLLCGLFKFYQICMIGAIVNVSIASTLFESTQNWILSGLTGVVMGSIWNYALSAIFIWNV